MFFIAWWRGKGLVVLLFAVACAAIGLLGAKFILGPEQALTGASAGIILASIPIHYYVKHLQKKAGMKYDQRSGHVYSGKIVDSLFSINLRKWPKIVLLMGSVSLVLFFFNSMMG